MSEPAHLQGWLKFHRVMLGHPVWNLPPGQTRVWLTILALASPKPGRWYDGQERVTIPPGSLITSQEHLAKAARVSRKVARAAVQKLAQMDCIRAKVRANRWTLIEVVNWHLYQASASEEGQLQGQPRANRNEQTGPTPGPTDLRGETGREGPTPGPTENAEQGHIWRSKRGREIGSSVVRPGGGGGGPLEGAPASPPDPPRSAPEPGSSQGKASREVEGRASLQNARPEDLTPRELEAIAGLLPALGDQDRASSAGGRVPPGPLPGLGSDNGAPCSSCGERRRWRSHAGVTLCGTCHPPGDPAMVAEWVPANKEGG